MSLASSAFSESAFAAFGVSPNVYENVTGLSATASVDDDSPVVVGESILVASDFEVTATLDDGFIVVAEALAIVDGTNLQAIVTVESDLPTVTGGAVVLATASQVTGQVGQPLVWGEIPVSQTPNYSVLAPDQTPSYTEISPSSDVTWADRAA